MLYFLACLALLPFALAAAVQLIVFTVYSLAALLLWLLTSTKKP